MRKPFTPLFVLAAFLLPLLTSQAQSWNWARTTGTTVLGEAAAIKTTYGADGRVYVLGQLNDTVTFGGTTIIGGFSDDVFLACYDTAGTVQWVSHWGGTGSETATALDVDVAGNIWVGMGFASDQITVNGATYTNAGGTSPAGFDASDAVLMKVSSTGQVLWATHFSGVDDNFITGLAHDGTGTEYVAGTYGTAFTLGTINVPATSDGFLAALDGTTWTWAVPGGSTQPSGAGPGAIAYDPVTSSVVVTGQYVDQAAFGTHSLTAASGGTQFDPEAYVASASAATGAWNWAATAGGDFDDWGTAIGVDASGNVLVGGQFNSTYIQIDNVQLLNLDQTGFQSNSFVGKLSPLGNWLWAARAGGTGANQLSSLSITPEGDAYVTGVVTDSGYFGTQQPLYWDISDYNTYLARIHGLTGGWQWVLPVNSIPACGCGHLANHDASVATGPGGRLFMVSNFTDSARVGTTALFGGIYWSSGQRQGYLASMQDELPLLLRLQPGQGGPGTVVTVTGDNFDNAARVSVGGRPATFRVVNATTLEVTIPANAVTGLIRVEGPDGSSNSLVNFILGPAAVATRTVDGVRVVQNPAKGSVVLESDNALPVATTVRLYDAQGRLVRAGELSAGATRVSLSVEGLSGGLYTLTANGFRERVVIEQGM